MRKLGSSALVTLWRGKIARIIGQSSDDEVKTLWKLMGHMGLTEHQKFLVLEGATFDVTGERMADREEEARVRRKRNREQAHQEKEFNEPTEAPVDGHYEECDQ